MKQKLMVICGGQSSEHLVSRMSCTSVMNNLNKEKYEVILTGIDKDGNWYELNQDQDNLCRFEGEILEGVGGHGGQVDAQEVEVHQEHLGHLHPRGSGGGGDVVRVHHGRQVQLVVPGDGEVGIPQGGGHRGDGRVGIHERELE